MTPEEYENTLYSEMWFYKQKSEVLEDELEKLRKKLEELTELSLIR